MSKRPSDGALRLHMLATWCPDQASYHPPDLFLSHLFASRVRRLRFAPSRALPCRLESYLQLVVRDPIHV